MTSDATLAMTAGILAADTALVLACQFIRREPFVTLNRWLADIWDGIYRVTGAAVLDRAINRRRAARTVRDLSGILAILPDGPGFAASRRRLEIAIDAARMQQARAAR